MNINGIKYYSMLESSGYGLAAISYLNALLDMGCPIHWIPLVFEQRGYQPWYQSPKAKQQVRKLLNECLSDGNQIERLLTCLEPIDDYQCILMHVVPEYWPYLKEEGAFHVGYTVWETSRLPRHFPKLINLVDRILVPSSFNQPIFEHSGVDIPVKVVPHILNSLPPPTAVTVSEIQKLITAQPNNYIFYSINTWTSRKAMWALVHAYLSTFTIADPVSLVLKTSSHGPRHATDESEHDTALLVSEIAAHYAKPAHIKVINHKITQYEIAALHELGDCFVSTSHSEGWGLGMFEAAGVGNPVIATGWGGQLDFLSDVLSYLTSYSLTHVIDTLGESSYSRDQLWAEPSKQSISQQLKCVFMSPDIAQQKAKKLASKLHKKYNSTQVGRQLYQAIYD